MEIFDVCPVSNEQQFVSFCFDGKLKEAQQFIEKSNCDIHFNRDEPFRICCMRGNYQMARWIYSLGHVDIHSIDESAFRMSCFKNYSNIAKWLYSIGEININILNESAFELSCKGGNLDIAKWLYELGVSLESLDIIFCEVCAGGDIEMLKWLLSLSKKGEIYSFDRAFGLACERGYVIISKWLYGLGGGKINIHEGDDAYFLINAKLRNMKMVRWLLTVDKFSQRCINIGYPYFDKETLLLLYRQGYSLMEKECGVCVKEQIKYYKTVMIVMGMVMVRYKRVCEKRYCYGGAGFHEAMNRFNLLVRST
ncbi:MAG: hypothetical protein Hyperionvirus12_11 [Hyperionvirus sp.]|uniref:Ankyrin repeat protein n=1 Tax=Hyperionvirus sp. TaxID=2487770 RepID=A0A3G5AB34_9VIRU|nr:MAG: hypothetical protein Hyperionvirus12_11 [Hyperionvirus sp.]